MKDSRLSVRMSTRRLNKLRQYAANKDKTVTQIIEDWIDRLPKAENGDSDARGLANASLSSTPLPNQPDG
jgi:hypothetical protein